MHVCYFFLLDDREILNYTNFDVTIIVTPVDADELEKLLIHTNYDTQKTKNLIQGFKKGFSIGYVRDLKETQLSPNLKLRVGDKVELWNKVMNEVKEKRFAGPFKQEELPFDKFIQLPIGLVPKDGGCKTRLIFHLSYARCTGRSVNANIPKEQCTVKYNDFDQAVKHCIEEGVNCKVGKSDMSRAFRNLPLKKSSWMVLVLKAQHPTTGEWFFFIDKCLPFGGSISCRLFQDFSDAIAFIVNAKNWEKDSKLPG